MKKYNVMLEYDVHITVEVEADNEEEAFEKAATKANGLPREEFINKADVDLNPDYYQTEEI